MAQTSADFGFWQLRQLSEFAPVNVTHVAVFLKGQMHAKSRAERLRRMGVAGQRDVVVQNFSVLGMGTVVDNGLGASGRALTAQIGDTLIGNDGEH